MVPNHMAIATNENAWWNDVLENGPASRYADYFDIAWHASPRAELQDKVLLPVLGEPYGDVLEAGQLRLAFEQGAFAVYYFDRRFPVAPCAYRRILGHRVEELEQALGAEAPELLEYHSILTAARNLPDRTETDQPQVAERQREKEVIKRRLVTLTAASAAVRAFIEQNVSQFNGKPGDPRSFDLLHELLERQCYRLSYWRVAPDEINYRRFFDINDLAALSMERLDVFEAAHALILRLLAEGKVDGLRIDHPDGLYDPAQYFRRVQEHYLRACARQAAQTDPAFAQLDEKEIEGPLHERIEERIEEVVRSLRERSLMEVPSARGANGPPFADDALPLYVIAEKILASDESLVADWPVAGTSGYEVVNMINGLFVDGAHAGAFTRLYNAQLDAGPRYAEIAYRKKLLILQVALASELHMLTHQLDHLAQKTRKSRDFTFNTLREGLRHVIACFPVYRSYIADDGVHDADRRYIEIAVRRAGSRTPLLSRRLFRFIRSMLLLESPESFTPADRAEQRRFAGKFQQVTAPVAAKGIEDTAFYVYNRLLSLNEVGGDPDRFGIRAERLHQFLRDRQAHWPHALSALSTHDTKRSEDMRARLNVLSEIPDDWRAAVERWRQLNDPLRQTIDDAPAPDPNDAYLLYQTLVGAWPLDPYIADDYAKFVERIQEYMAKAQHEAKVHTSWINPNAEYDAAVREFVARILDERASAPFLADFRAFQRRVSHYGLFNSLAQTVLRITVPGVPDTYQGTELWDFSLVDPDNRRPVDYEHRQRLLAELQEAEHGDRCALTEALLAAKEDGRIKLYVTYRALRCRRDHPGLFSAGVYLPLEIAGTHTDHVFAFARRAGDQWAIVAVPRLLTHLVADLDQPPLGPAVWLDTRLKLADIDPSPRWRNIFTGERVSASERDGVLSLPAAALFAHCPVAVLLAE